MNRYSIGMLALLMLPGVSAPALATDLLTIYREAVVQDSTYAGAKAQYIGAQGNCRRRARYCCRT